MVLLNDIPDPHIQKVLTFLPIKNAGQFASLNKSWRNNWLNIPRLYFDASDFQDEFDLQGGLNRMFQAVHEVLQRRAVLQRPETLLEFGVRAQAIGDNPLMNETLLILRTYAGSLVRLSIDCMTTLYSVPNTLYEFRSLTHLTLHHCIFAEPFVDFPLLEHLSLNNCEMTNAALVHSLGVCPSLSRVSLLRFILVLEENQIPIQEFVNVVCRAKYLAVRMGLIKAFSWDVLPGTPDGNNNLEELYIDEVNFQVLNTAAVVANFLRVFPRVSKLKIKCVTYAIERNAYYSSDSENATSDSENEEAGAEVDMGVPSEASFYSLLHVKILNYRKGYTEAARHLLERSPLLKSIELFVKKRPLHESRIRSSLEKVRFLSRGAVLSILDFLSDSPGTSSGSDVSVRELSGSEGSAGEGVEKTDVEDEEISAGEGVQMSDCEGSDEDEEISDSDEASGGDGDDSE